MDTILILTSAILAFVLTYISIPPIIRVSKAKHLFDEINKRKVHKSQIPSLGGVAIFIGLVISLLLTINGFDFLKMKYLLAGVIMVFFIGLKDDIMVISAQKKLLVQITAALIITVLGGYRFTNLHGMFGIHDLGYTWSVLISVFAIVGITNAYNLIDGIDGLASGVAMVAALTFGTWFLVAGHPEYAVLSYALTGSLLAFIRYNVFGKEYKLFMGDTGSLIIGLVISALVIRFNEVNILYNGPHDIVAAPVVSLAVIIVPVIDTIRVFTVRILRGKSPFSPDKNHVHHWLLDLYKNHIKVTSTIVVVNILLILAGLAICKIGVNINVKFALLFILGIMVALIPKSLLIYRDKKNGIPQPQAPVIKKPRMEFSAVEEVR